MRCADCSEKTTWCYATLKSLPDVDRGMALCRATFRSKLIPNAVRWYTGEANEDDEDDDEGYDEEDDDEDDDEDDEDEVSGIGVCMKS